MSAMVERWREGERADVRGDEWKETVAVERNRPEQVSQESDGIVCFESVS